MDMNITTLPKKGLKTKPYNVDMNKDIVTLPKKGLKTRLHNIGMENHARVLMKMGISLFQNQGLTDHFKYLR